MSIDPKLNYCRCGYTWKFTRFDILLMFLGLKDTFRCPRCQALMKFKLIYHTAKVSTENIDRGELWKQS